MGTHKNRFTNCGIVLFVSIGIVLFSISMLVYSRPFWLAPLFGKAVMGSISGTVTDATTGEPMPNVPVKISFSCPHGIDPLFDIDGSGFRCFGVQSTTKRTDKDGKFIIRKNGFWRNSHSVSYTLVVNDTGDVTTTLNASGSLINDFTSIGDGTGMSTLPKANGYHAFLAHGYDEPPYKALGQPKHYDISLLKMVGTIADCARLPTDDAQTHCLQILAYTAAEAYWPHGGNAYQVETSAFFEDYFVRRFTAELNKSCAANSNESECIMLRAAQTGDVSTCVNLVGRSLQEKCNMWAAVFSKNASPCEIIPKLTGQYIKSPYTDGKCLVYSAIWSQDRAICEQLTALYEDESRRTGYKYTDAYLIPTEQCWTKLAVQNDDPSLCDPVPDVDLSRDDCVRAVSER